MKRDGNQKFDFNDFINPLVLSYKKIVNMKNRISILISFLLLFIQQGFTSPGLSDEPKTLSIGTAAPNFSLKGVDNKAYTLASFNKYNILVIIFSCNHCPTAQAYEDRLIQMTREYGPKGVAIVA